MENAPCFCEDPRRIHVVYHNDLYNVLGSVAYNLSHNLQCQSRGLYGDVKYLLRNESLRRKGRVLHVRRWQDNTFFSSIFTRTVFRYLTDNSFAIVVKGAVEISIELREVSDTIFRICAQI